MRQICVYIPMFTTLICCLVLTSCRPRLYSESNTLYVYAPNNQLEIHGITQTKTNGNIPFRYDINDNQLHFISTDVITEFKKGLYYPNADYDFYITAANTKEYYIYIPYVLRINNDLEDLLTHCSKYGTEIVINAIKDQTPEDIICISSTEEQTIKGLYFRQEYRGHISNITIEQ